MRYEKKVLRPHSNRNGPTEIEKILAEDDIEISHWSVIRFLIRRFSREVVIREFSQDWTSYCCYNQGHEFYQPPSGK